MSTENELKRAYDLIARIICKKVEELDASDSFQVKDLKELTSVVKDLSAIERVMSDGSDTSEIKIIFEGGDVKWAQ